MDGELWNGLYRALRKVASTHHDPSGVVFSDKLIVEVHLWAVLHDRPISWACNRKNWPPHRRGRKLPSNATMSRRLRRLSVLQLLEALEDYLRESVADELVWCIDGMPLPVGGHSKDREARWGRAANGFAKGYKLFAVISGDRVLRWQIGPMNQGESSTADPLLLAAAQQFSGAYVLGDPLYDTNRLYALCRGFGMRLMAARKKPGTSLGHHPQDPDRLRCIEELEGGHPFACAMFAHRLHIEQYFGNAASFGGGLAPLPRFVRRPHRVARWIHGKLLINYTRLRRLHHDRHRGEAA